MKQALVIASQNKELNDILDEMQRLKKHHNERMTFMEKQVKVATEDAKKKYFALWQKIEKSLQEQNLFPPEYDPKKFCLTIHDDTRVISMESKEEDVDKYSNPFKTLLKSILFETEKYD